MLNQAAFERVKGEAERAGATLVAVTKQRPVAVIERMYALGQRDFGENRVAEIQEKHAALPKDIRWHFIGHLQRNKVKDLVPFVHLIHSGDSPRLIRAVNKAAVAEKRIIPVLLQYHIAREDSKYGLDPEDPDGLFDDLGLRDLTNIRPAGVMGMATYTDDQERVAGEFRTLKRIFDELKDRRFSDAPHFREISMGMSGDYRLALENGSTLIRVGSLLYD